MKDRLKFGIIGCGWVAFEKHLPSLAKQPDAEISACCDVVEEKAQRAVKKYGASGAKVYTSYREMLKDESIDVVHVATPNMTHREITIDCLKAGKHVLCEKPMAMREEDARAMIEAAKTFGKKLTVGFQWRFRPACLYLHDLAQKGYFGDIYFARAHALRRRGVPTWGSYLNKKENGGGALAMAGRIQSI